MTLKWLLVHSTIAAIFLIGGTCQANNNLFLPGDAFFPTTLTKLDVEALQKKAPGGRTFRYSSFGGYEGMFCGYAGYENATIPAVDDAFANNLAIVYSRIREYDSRELVEHTSDGKVEQIETNGIRVLFYPPEFKFPDNVLGLQYNENWVAETVKFGHKQSMIRLCSLIDDPAAVEQCWRDAAIVPALKVKLPDVALKSVPKTEEPVVVQGPVKAFVIGSLSLKDLFRRTSDDHDTIYVVDSAGITELTLDDYESPADDSGYGEWRPTDEDRESVER